MEEDRISELPEQLHHHILCLLPQDDAVRTCVLSKSWRHLGPTRPKLEFHEDYFRGRKQKFIFAVEEAFKRYADQNLSIQDLTLDTRWENFDALLNKWIRQVIMNNSNGVKTFNLGAYDFFLPPVVFESEILEQLYLKGCIIDNNCIINVKLHVLKRLSLKNVCIDNETFEKIISSCPSIQHLVLRSSRELSTIKVNKARNLKHFYFQMKKQCETSSCRIEIDCAPSLETMRIEGDYSQIWYPHNDNFFFPRLKTLYLCRLHLTTELLNNLSSDNCPCLQELQLHDCRGFSEFKLSNRSIQRLIININDRPIKAAIDAANMLYFEFGMSDFVPDISFATTSREWKSRIHLRYPDDGFSTWYLKLYEFLKALSQSQISVEISGTHVMNEGTFDGASCEPVVVEHLILGPLNIYPPIPSILNCVFHICCPRYIGVTSFIDKHFKTRLLWMTLVGKLESRQCKFWNRDLEETSIQVLDEKTKEWRSVQACALPDDENIRFRLKWRDLS